MAYDEALAERIRALLAGRDAVTERKMFGGIAFMVGGNMACGVIHDDLMVRVGPDAHDAALAEPHARPMDFAHRPMRGMVYVDPDGVALRCRAPALGRRRRQHARSLPPSRKRRDAIAGARAKDRVGVGRLAPRKESDGHRPRPWFLSRSVVLGPPGTRARTARTPRHHRGPAHQRPVAGRRGLREDRARRAAAQDQADARRPLDGRARDPARGGRPRSAASSSSPRSSPRPA